MDFVIEHGRRVLAIEIKRTTQPGYRDTEGIRSFLNNHPQASGGMLVHGGRDIRRLDENIIAVPWTLLTG